MPAKEKRTYERTPVHLEVLLHLNGHDPILCQSRDFSEKGVFLEFVENLNTKIIIGEKGDISVAHQSDGGKEIISTNISVVRITPDGIGLSFLSEASYRHEAA